MRAWALVVVAVLVAGCAHSAGPPTVPAVPQFSHTAPASGGGDPADGRPVPKTCDEVLTVEEISTVLGVLVTGTAQPVVGQPQASIGRTARLDCYFGMPARKPVSAATVWVALSTYTDPAAARNRLTSTVSTERAAGSQVNEVPVGDGQGVLLRGKAWTLIAVRGKTTAAVTVRPDLVREDRAGAMLGQLADKALTPHQPAPG